MARGVRLPGDAWTPRDWALQQAVDLLDAVKCSGCGQPRWLSHDKAFKKQWKASVEVCFACQAREQKAKEFDEHPHPRALHSGVEFVGDVPY